MKKLTVVIFLLLALPLPFALLAAPPDPGATLWMVEMPRISITMPPATPPHTAPISPLPTPAPIFSPLPTPDGIPLCLWIIAGDELRICGWRGPDWKRD